MKDTLNMQGPVVIQGEQGIPGPQGLIGVEGHEGKRGKSGFTNHSLANKISSIILSILLITLAVVSYFILVPYKILEVSSVEILTPEVKAGEQLEYRVKYCKYRDLPATVSKTLVNGTLIPFTPYVSNLPIGCEVVVVYQEVPLYAPSGIYHINVVSTFSPNPIRTINIEYRTPSFIIKGTE